MRAALWNILTVFTLLATLATGFFVTQVFANPYSSLNPLKPPTLPPTVKIPTSTATLRSLPATWTSTSGAQQAPALKPTSTPIPRSTRFRLDISTKTYTPAPTKTSTKKSTSSSSSKTKTPTEVSAATKTKTKTRTRTATDDPAAPTKTNTPIPSPTSLSNPSSARELNGVSNNTWQNSENNPNFEWDPKADATGYYVYFGSNADGTSSEFTEDPAFDPDVVTTGTYYMRVRTRYGEVEVSSWSTIFTFRYDNEAPSNPSAPATESHGVESGVGQSAVTSPSFTWSGADDGSGSGIDGYYVYFGLSESGTSSTFQSGNSLTVSDLAPSTYYLRARAVDALDQQASGWITLFTFVLTAP
jgi:hypothetical protein